MQSLFGLELTTAQKVIVASVVILVLLALLGLFVRQIQGGRLRVPGQAGGRQRQPRLGIVDTYDLDRQRQLVLIRRDNVEHLLMVGGASDVVVESNIMRGNTRSTTPIFNEASAQDRPLPPFETLVPPSEPALRAGEELRRTSSAHDALDAPLPAPVRPQDIPVEAAATAAVVSATVAITPPKPVAAPAFSPPSPVPQPPILSGQAPSFAREHAPAPNVSPGELDDMARQLEAALKRPFSAVRPANVADEAREDAVRAPVIVTPPPAKPSAAQPPANAGSAKAADEAKSAEPKSAEPKPAEPKPAEAKALEPKPVPLPKAPEPTPAPVKPQAMLDMEAELEAALGLKPKPADTRPAEPKAPPPVPAVVANPVGEPVRTGAPAQPPRPVEPEIVVPDAAPKPASAAAPSASVEPKPVAESVKADGPAPEPQKPTEPTKELDPFSVDAIEAEFARLLGRDPKKTP